MRIGILAPITHPVPPSGYGPWERIAGDLADGLVERDHDVTVFGPAGSSTSARLVATVPYPLSEWPTDQDQPDSRIWEEIHIAELVAMARGGDFDVVHSHLHVHALGYAQTLPCPLITTLHGVAWNRAVHPALDRNRHQPFVSISDSERAFYPGLRYVRTVHNGVRTGDFPMGSGGDDLLFVGRMAPEKAPHLAIQTALGARRNLRMVGTVEPRHQEYFDTAVKPFLDRGGIEFLGSMDRRELAAEYGRAAALVMPLEWDEPFGLVVAEALLTGTPVIAWRRGAMPELVQHGKSGFLVSGVDEAVAAVGEIAIVDRRACRAWSVSQFGLDAMVEGYLDAYLTEIDSYTGRIASINPSTSTIAIRTPRSAKP